ncbi:CTP pyrophosphohydrolase [Marinomonas spartinae]|uniref:8-oxo-dGTP diphosphatase n=1 Tax=Marinomonas spartinae TaxID=1792290 RepID=A0A1A8TTP0_9GAMM|nr:NUDIX domain-containing protein [Marinomonas spartinae]SBS31852.1 CTP pyrophosphohydrolase [Marinomonas spartinae]SBS36821.1 CTP pyrophosphohydrolase [Marinomonas spartinae]
MISECVSFLLIQDEQVLLEKRADDKASDPSLIAIPGGHIEPGESQLDTLIRELKEELDVIPDSHHYLCSLYHPTNELQLIHYYVIPSWTGQIKSLEAETVFWHEMQSAPIDVAADVVAVSEYFRVYSSL